MNRKLENFIEYFQYLKNPVEALMFKFGIKKECKIKIKNTNHVINLSYIPALNKLMNKLPTTNEEKISELISYIKDINDNKEIVLIDNIRYYNVYNDNFIKNHSNEFNTCNEEYFSDDQWDMLSLQNRNIIDVGGNIADTALFFAKNGANVIAFEPVKHLYDLAIDNISINPNLEDKIQFINKAVGAKKGMLDITDSSTKEYIKTNDSYEIEVITINDILKNYDFPADVLKMDCEGCEFEIIETNDLSMFNEIIFEHHSYMVGKSCEPLIKQLEEQNFKINTYPCNTSRRSFDEIGIIHAFK